jgi:hypothetical protein
MDALTYLWEVYMPKAPRWSHIGRGTPPPPDTPYIRFDTKLAPVSILDSFVALKGVSIGHATQHDVEAIATIPAITCVSLAMPRITSLAPLSKLSGLESLELDDPPTIAGIEGLISLKCLVLRHFRRITNLAPLSCLSNLRAVSMSTIPSWDASRRCLEIDSLEPLRKLINLESLRLMGIKPLDRRLDPLHDLTNLKYLHISHEFQFQLEDYAALARALPETSGHCLLPYYTIPQLSLRCKRCDGEIVFLTGPRPRTRRQLCPVCDERKLQRHERQWNDAVKIH